MKTYRPELEARYEFLLLGGHAKELNELHQQLGYSSELETDDARNNSEAIANAIAADNFDDFVEQLCLGVPLSGREFAKFYFDAESFAKQEKFLAALWTHPTVSSNLKLLSEVWNIIYTANQAATLEKFFMNMRDYGVFSIADLLQSKGKSSGILNSIIFNSNVESNTAVLKLILRHLKECPTVEGARTPLEIELAHFGAGYSPLHDSVRYNQPKAVRAILEVAADNPKLLKEMLGAKIFHQGKEVTAIGMLIIIPKRELTEEDIAGFKARGMDYNKVLEIKGMLLQYQKMVDDLDRTLAITTSTASNTTLATTSIPNATAITSLEINFYDAVQVQQHSTRARLTNSDVELFHFFGTF